MCYTCWYQLRNMRNRGWNGGGTTKGRIARHDESFWLLIFGILETGVWPVQTIYKVAELVGDVLILDG